MTRRARRSPATLPARRGMRAAWFRGRAPLEPEAQDDQEPPPPSTDPGTTDATAGAVEPPRRPAFGHPTF